MAGRFSTLTALQRVFLLLAFVAAAAAALLALRLDRLHEGISLLRVAAIFIVAAIVVSLAIIRTRRRPPFDPRANRPGRDE